MRFPRLLSNTRQGKGELFLLGTEWRRLEGIVEPLPQVPVSEEVREPPVSVHRGARGGGGGARRPRRPRQCSDDRGSAAVDAASGRGEAVGVEGRVEGREGPGTRERAELADAASYPVPGGSVRR